MMVDVALVNDLRARAEEVADLIRPVEAIDTRRERLGRPNDGGYVIVSDLQPNQPVYSLGISDDVSFDLDLAERGHDIYMYDHTIEGLPVAHPRFHFYKRAIDTGAGSLQAILAENGHSERDDVILKMDIEHAEYDVIPATPPAVLRQFKQIVIELHWITDVAKDNLYPSIISTLRALRRDHDAVHIHANNYGETRYVDCLPLPGCIELTLLRRDSYRFQPTSEYFPTPLDMPNNPKKGDLQIGTIGLGNQYFKQPAKRWMFWR